MSSSTGAVFLSYASEDSEAAERIASALKAAGIEVWFDKSELRGGDAWDRAIRKQIHDCALFIPIISAHSQSRLEGYFRREWKLAVDRTHDMAEEKAFLVPVVIDNAFERNASVPDKFRDVQWTRLPNGEPSPTFISRLLALLGSEAPAASGGMSSVALVNALTSRTLSRPTLWSAIGFAALVVVAGAGWLVSRHLGPIHSTSAR